MSEQLICREEECAVLEQAYISDRAEMLALYGRRRVGKTFLIRAFFSNKEDVVFFNSTGMKDGSMAEQIANFTEEMGRAFLYKGARLEAGKNWRETFRLLTDAIGAVPLEKKIVLFFDEFPWMATKNSRLLQQLDYFWNQHWSQNKRIKLVVCGSSASWMINKIIRDKGGLHNRLTREILLEPLTLGDTNKFLMNIDVKLSQHQVLSLYIVTGGIPYYLFSMSKNLSVVQNIEDLCFRKKGLLVDEFDKLYSSLFKDHDLYVDIIREVSSHQYGLGQSQLFKLLPKLSKGKTGLAKLDALIQSGFLISFKPMGNSKKGVYYRTIDEYTLFYLSWIEPIKQSLQLRSMRRGYWERQQRTAAWYSWSGYSFEAICYKHVAQISAALKLGPTAIPHTWRHVPGRLSNIEGAQIDLLFDRDDDAITLCEIQYTEKPFVIDKDYAVKLRRKIDVFRRVTKTKKQIFLAFIAANGLKKNKYTDELVNGVVVLEDLFSDIY